MSFWGEKREMMAKFTRQGGKKKTLPEGRVLRSNGCKNKFLDEAVHGYMNGHLTVGAGLGGQVDDFAGELFPDVAFGAIAFHFVEKDVPHLVVAAQVFNFMYQLILCHREVPPLINHIISYGNASVNGRTHQF